MRGEVFEAHQHLARKGDWWCFRLNADELYLKVPFDHIRYHTPFSYLEVRFFRHRNWLK